jgi:hypothetical protein
MAGVGFAGLRAATVLWASAVFTVTVLVLSAAVLGAMAHRGRGRLAWAGYAVFGWVYLAMTFGPWPNGNAVSTPPFLTQAILSSFEPDTRGGADMVIDTGPQGEPVPDPPGAVVPKVSRMSIRPGATAQAPFSGRVISMLQYRRVGHSLGALLSGLVRGLVGRFFAARGGLSEDTSA